MMYLIGFLPFSFEGSIMNKAYNTPNANIGTSEKDVKQVDTCGPWVLHPYFWLIKLGYFGREEHRHKMKCQ